MLAAQLPNPSQVHMLVQNVSWLPFVLCNIVHRGEEEAQGVVVDGRKG
jgi:hypothetical protein